jgi:FkbM family methyltransferase
MKIEDIVSTPINAHYAVVNSWQGQFLLNRHDVCSVGSLIDSEKEIRRLLSFVRGNVVDIGANVGSHTLAFARYAEHVFAFEPQPPTFFALCANLLLNVVHNVTPVNIALGNRIGTTTMHRIDPRFPHASAGEGVGFGELAVSLRTLDSLNLPNISFIKIDVEHSELEVLRGAVETLTKYHPTVYVEIHEIAFILPITDLMESLGYLSHEFINIHIAYPPGEQAEGQPDNLMGYLFEVIV